MNLFLRTFADCESPEAARVIARRIELALSHFSPQPFAKPNRYWKMPHLFEFTYLLAPATEASFQEVVGASTGSWEHSRAGKELSSIWSRQLDHSFLSPEVCWAELQLHEQAA